MDERDQVLFGTTPINYRIRRSDRRKKTVELTIDGHQGVVVAAPADTRRERIRAIVKKRAPWIVRNGSPERLEGNVRLFLGGESLPYLGRQVRLFTVSADVDRCLVKFDHWSFRLLVPINQDPHEQPDKARRAFRRWYEERAIERLRASVQKWAKSMDVSPAEVLVRNQRNRWGSCSPDGALRFNWRIVMAEPALIEYVVVHELAHLRVRTHRSDFWQLVASALPDFRLRRAALRSVGAELVL